MSFILFEAATGEIRARAFDEEGNPLLNATLTCTLYNGRSRPTVVFSDRAMPYSPSHPFTDTGDLGCYFCTLTADEMNASPGVWRAVVLITDAIGNELPVTIYLNVTPYVAT